MTPAHAASTRPVALVIAGGPAPKLQRSDLPAVDLVIAVDSGFDHAVALGIAVDLLVGDLDSISPAGLRLAQASSVAIERYPAAKNETDLEIALEAATERDVERIILVGATGGRLDHQLANIGVLAACSASNRIVELWTAAERIVLIAGDTNLTVPAGVGTTVSLLPIGGPVTGVTTAGLEWPLHDATLSPFRALGVSNVVIGEGAAVAIRSGSLAVVINLDDD